MAETEPAREPAEIPSIKIGGVDRRLVIAIFTALGMLFALTGYNFYLALEKNGPLLGEYRSPRKVLSTRPGVEGPAITSEGMLLTRGYRCIRQDTTVLFSVVYYRADVPIEERARSAVVDPVNREVVKNRESGCFDEDILLSLPTRVEDGHYWYIQAAELSRVSGDFKLWTTEPFYVVPRP